VTGATGFLGRHLLRLLQDGGATVRALVRRPPSPRLDADVVIGAVEDARAAAALVDGCTAVFHTAAMVTPWVSHPEAQYRTNVDGTCRVVEAAVAAGVPVVVTSSISVLDPYPAPRLIRAIDRNHYVRSKRRALEHLREARRAGAHVTALLPSGITGPGDCAPTAIGRLVRDTMLGRPPRACFDGGIYLIDVRDVARAHVLALGVAADDYALPGEYWPLRRLFTYVGGLGGRRRRQVPVPTQVAVAGAAVLNATAILVTRRAPLVTPAWVHHLASAGSREYPDDSSRLGLALRPVEDSLTDSVNWFRDRGRHESS
jgi:dihydroflavonol-4-reductase